MTKRITTRRAFSLIELMVVILILAVVIAIIVPALGGARNAAKSVSSKATLTQVSNAAAAYSNDHQETMPGYFTSNEMGDSQNGDRGFTELENVMLHLAGGLVDPSQPGMGSTIGGSDYLEVGPLDDDSKVAVDPALIGADTTKTGAYYTPDASLYHADNGQQGEKEHQELPDLVDAWGSPILAWRRNQFGPVRIDQERQFAGIDSSEPAWFYWNSNAGFLNGDAVGKLTKDQFQFSMIGGGMGDTDRSKSLTGFLGSPAYPGDLALAKAVLPGAARGELVLHSAGADGVFLHNDSNGSKQFEDKTIDYYRNFFSTSGQPITGDDGKNETRDILRPFDDLVQTGN